MSWNLTLGRAAGILCAFMGGYAAGHVYDLAVADGASAVSAAFAALGTAGIFLAFAARANSPYGID